MSIKLLISSAFALLIICCIAFLYLFDVSLFPYFYRTQRQSDCIDALKEIEVLLNDASLAENTVVISPKGETTDLLKECEKIVEKYTVNLFILDESMFPLLSVSTSSQDLFHILKNSSLFYLYDLTLQNNKNLFLSVNLFDDNGSEAIYYTDFTSDNALYLNMSVYEQNNKLEMLYNEREDEKTNQYFCLVSCEVAPSSTFLSVITNSLVLLAIILVFFMIVVLLIIHLLLVRPILNIANKSGMLTYGNLNFYVEKPFVKELNILAESINYSTVHLSKVEHLQRELIANVSHDLKTPITIIRGYGEMICDFCNDENSKTSANKIVEESQRLLSMVNDLLDVSKIQSGNFPVNKIDFDLTLAIKDLLSLFVGIKDTKVSFFYNENITIFSDKTLLTTVIKNLVSNALTHTSNGVINVYQDFIKSKNSVMIIVEDFGQGISQDKINEIWDRYYKVDEFHKRAKTGTGLGLNIVKTVMDTLSGTYGVKSKINTCTQFYIEIPIGKNLENSNN